MNKPQRLTLLSFTLCATLTSCHKDDSAPLPPQGQGHTISSIKPVTGPSSITDTITGTGFSTTLSDDSVYFNGKSAKILSATATSLVVKVPVGAGTGNVSVVIKGKSVNGPVFTFTGDSLYTVSTIAGAGTQGAADGPAATATFTRPNPIIFDRNGNMLILEFWNNDIRMLTPAGIVSTFAGSTTAGYVDGPRLTARFNRPCGIATDPAGNLYVADYGNHMIRKITPDGTVSTVAGSTTGGYVDGPAASARFTSVSAIIVDGQSNLIVFDGDNHRVRKITPDGMVSTIAGSGKSECRDGTGTAAGIGWVQGICIDADNNIYFCEPIYNCIRKLTPAGVITTIAGNMDASNPGLQDGTGSGAMFAGPSGITMDKYNNLYVTDKANNALRKVTLAGVVTTIAGSRTMGKADGPGATATFGGPGSLVFDAQGNLYVSEEGNNLIRKLTPM